MYQPTYLENHLNKLGEDGWKLIDKDKEVIILRRRKQA